MKLDYIEKRNKNIINLIINAVLLTTIIYNVVYLTKADLAYKIVKSLNGTIAVKNIILMIISIVLLVSSIIALLIINYKKRGDK